MLGATSLVAALRVGVRPSSPAWLAAPASSRVLARRCYRAGTRLRCASLSIGFEAATVANDIPVLQVGPSDAPAVIAIQEWWGVTEEDKKRAGRIVKAGKYRCIIPDLYKGKIGVDAEEASHLMSNLDFKKAIEEISQVAAWAKQTSPSVAVAGFCMGGALSLCAAQHSRDICAAISFYGIPDPSVCQPDKISVPVQLHFGELDNMKGFSDPESARALAQKLSDAGVEYELFMYTGVGHAFMNAAADHPEITPGKHASTGFPPSDPDQRELAWSRVFRFLQLAFADAPAAGRSSQPSS